MHHVQFETKSLSKHDILSYDKILTYFESNLIKMIQDEQVLKWQSATVVLDEIDE